MSSTPTQAQPRLYADRAEAGRLLAEELRPVLPATAVVVGLARGGIVVAAEIARTLDLALDVVAVRKVGAPWQPEYALGAVAPGDGVFIHDRAGLPDETLGRIVAETRARAEALDRRLHCDDPAIPLTGRVCALVDDGLATGATMIAAIRWALARGAGQVVAAVPLGARRSLTALEAESATVVCPFRPEDFWAVGFWYRDFRQVDDDRVVALLAEGRT